LPVLRVIAIAAVIFAGLPTTSAGAEHDMVYAPCDPEDTRPVDEQVWFIDYQSGDMLRFDDPWWGERPSAYTNWRHQCRLGMTGVWQAAPILPLPHPPTHTVESRDAIQAAPPTTTTTAPPTTTVAPQPAPPEDEPQPSPEPLPSVDTPDGYDLFDAEWDGYPFEQTILLLEERYPPGTPDRFHFRLSVAVEFLRQGGMVKGLDNLWESGS
jgi:hypothetical protein